MKATLQKAALFFAVLGFSSSAAAQDNICIAEAAKQSINACANSGPSNFNVSSHGKTPQTNFHSAPAPADLKKRDQVQKPPAVDVDVSALRDPGKKLQSRAKALLVTEIGGLEQLFSKTAKNAPDRVTLARRLAEDYVELETVAFREKTQAEIDRDAAKKGNPAEAGKKQAAANQAGGLMAKARAQAQNYYSIIKNEYPNYQQLDEVLYYLAYEYEQANDNKNARAVYYELIQKRPDSKYIPNAYLAFGELFFNEAAGDPSKWELAKQAYMEVIKFPAEKNKVYGYAWYKLGYVLWNQGDFKQALNSFKKTIDWGNSYAQTPGASKLADSARRDSIPVYALSGDPGAAYNYFHAIAGDAGGSNEKTFKMLDDLGQNYLDTGHYPEAIQLYRDLMVRDKNGEKHCNYQSHITEATLAMKSNNKEAIKVELDNQVKNYQAFKADHKPDSVLECANKTAALTAETAMAWHLEAVGSGGQRGTGDQKTMSLAAYLYKKTGETFTKEEFSKFTFPRIVKEDWPTIYKIKYAMADLLYFQQRWAECGPAFDQVVEEDPNGPEAAESAYAAVLCYQNIYEQKHQGKAKYAGSGNLPGQKKTEKEKKADADKALDPKALTDEQKGMLSAFNRYICYIKPGANDATGLDQLTEVKFARARTYFEAQHWEEAAATFKDIAFDPKNAGKEIGIGAGQLYLESVNVLGSHSKPARPACYDDMGNDVPKMQEMYCSGEGAKKFEQDCTSLAKIQCDIQRLKAQSLVSKADQGATNAIELYSQAGQTYFDLWKKYGEAPLASGQPGQCDRLDEIVYNSGRSFQAARLVAKAIQARLVLLDPRWKMEKSEAAQKATYEIGGNYQAIAVYDKAAEWYERYAQIKLGNKRPEKADIALTDATILRLGLGTPEDERKAIEDAREFRALFGGSKPAQTASIAFAIGSHYADKEDWTNAVGTLKGSLDLFNKANLDVQVQAHATLARSLLRQKGPKKPEALAQYAKVRALWSDAPGAVKKIQDSYPNEGQPQVQRRIGKSLEAVGEATFYAAEEVKENLVDKIKFPEYKGKGTKEDVVKHIQTKVKDWMEKKRPAIEKAEAEYKKIVNLQPDAPPKWVIAAGSRVGLMWGAFVDDFRAAPIPEAWKKDDEMRNTYYNNLDQSSEPIKSGRAKPALKTCLDYSVKFQYFDDYSRNCEVWLAKNYKAEYHVVDELRGAPTLANGGLDERPPPIAIGGQIYHPPSTEKATEKAGEETEKAVEKTEKKKGAR